MPTHAPAARPRRSVAVVCLTTRAAGRPPAVTVSANPAPMLIFPQSYTPAEVARLLPLSLSTTYGLLRDGTIPAVRDGRRWVIQPHALLSWLDSLPRDGGAPAGPPLVATPVTWSGRPPARGPLRVSYRELSGWTSPVRHADTLAHAAELRDAALALAGRDAAGRRTWTATACTCLPDDTGEGA